MQMSNVLGLILGGGAGTRLYPLTKERAKPAVPLAGKYRLIDIPMSNCIHADIEKIAILTQFNSVSLHRHIYSTYSRDIFSSGWVQILAAEQTPRSHDWYQGTADAVRKQLLEIREAGAKYVLILAGDHLYRMDYRRFVQYHADSEADITIAVQPVSRQDASSLGILKLSSDNRISRFTEKPKTDEALEGLSSREDADKPYMASMGIYVFHLSVLTELLSENKGDDFGRDIIPAAIDSRRVVGYVYDGFWEDIGTIRRFYEVNLRMASPTPPFDFFSGSRPLYTHPRFLPSSIINGGHMNNVLLGDGVRIEGATVQDSVVGLRSAIWSDVTVKNTVLMGADYYETREELEHNQRIGRPDIGIASGCEIDGAIIDKNARIGRNVVIRYLEDREDAETEHYVSRDGLVIVPKNTVIPDNTII